MSEQDLLNQIAAEAEPGFSGQNEYEKRRDREPSKMMPVYKVWNKNPKWDEAKQGPQPMTPGMLMITQNGEEKEREHTEKVQAVILYTSQGRRLETGMGKNFRVLCQSHDGINPSVRIDEPLCRQAKTSDLVRIMSKWKGMDQAKIDARIKELTDDSGSLQVCGLKVANGAIELCPFARRNELTNKKGDCTPHIYVQAFDIKRKRLFKMELTGKAIYNSNFISPYHEFFKYLRQAGPKGDGLPCYAFVVDLSSATDGSTNYLNITNWRPIENAANRNEMKELAIKAKDGYLTAASRLSKEAYEKAKGLKEVEKKASAPAQADTSKAELPRTDEKPVAQVPAPPSAPVSFEDDDIPF